MKRYKKSTWAGAPTGAETRPCGRNELHLLEELKEGLSAGAS